MKPRLFAAVPFLLVLAASTPLKAQDATARVTAAGPTRLPHGKPGPGYWQQRVDCRVEATLDPVARRLTGTEWITYHNNAPDTLRELWWHLYQNVFRADSEGRERARELGRLFRTTKGMAVHRVETDGVTLETEIQGTLMRTPLAAPLPPGATLALRVEWEYEVPEGARLRTGSEGRDFGMTQWYPQIAVYDDQRGWDRTPYVGPGEFYLEYGDWEVRLTVPADYVVAATGVLENAEEVLTPAQAARLRSISADSVVSIIAAQETGTARPVVAGDEGTKTWRFRARDVRDFAWAASPAYIWEATRTRGTAERAEGIPIYAFYKPREARFWQTEGALMARHAVEFFDAHFGRYIYPQATTVSGPVTGMEYPMVAFAGRGDRVTNSLYLVIAHELGHQWYPMMIGSPEADYPFMDEGFNTFITSLAVRDRYGRSGLYNPKLSPAVRRWLPEGDERLLNQTLYVQAARGERETPVLTHAHDMPLAALGIAAYQKPGTVLFMLADVIGAETLERALQEYYRRWLLKHPYPDDFFNTVEHVAGRDLDWFWNEWFVQTWQLDIAVTDVRQGPGEGGWTAEIELENRERARMPARIRLTLEDGSARDVRVEESPWAARRRTMLRADSLPARVRAVEVDPELWLADVNRLNNRWPRPRIALDARPNAIMDLLPPLDAYRVGVRPSVWYSTRDGADVGFAATGSYLGSDRRLSLLASVGTRAGTPDGRLTYQSRLKSLGSGAAWRAEAFRLDGRAGGSLGIEIGPPGPTLLGSVRGSTSLSVALRGIDLQDPSYLPRRDEWEEGRLVAGTARLRRSVAGWWGTAWLQAALELSGPGSDWDYGKVGLDLRMSRSLGGASLAARLTGGYATGDVPAQTTFYLAQASPWERFGSIWFRSRGVLEALGIAEEARLAGGAGVMGATVGARGTRMLAGNVALQWKLFELFADAGDVWAVGGIDTERWVLDAGPGLGFELPLGFGPAPMAGWGLRLRAPLWVHDPVRPDRDGWGWRWRVLFGGRWGP